MKRGVAIALLAFAHAALYALLIPLWQSPDEPQHVEYVLLVAERGPWVSGEDTDLAIQERIVSDMNARDFYARGLGFRPPPNALTFESVWPSGAGQLDRPPLYRLLGALVIAPLGDTSIESQVIALRLYSAILFALTVAAIYAIARAVLPNRPGVAVGAAGVVALLPMPSYLGGSVSNDNLANLIVAAALLIIVLAERRGWRPWQILALLALVVAGFFTKRTTLLLVPLAGIVLTVAVIQARRAVQVAALIGVVAVSGAAATLLVISEDARQLAERLADRYLANVSFGGNLASLAGIDLTWQSAADLVTRYGPTVFRGFWGIYGWAGVRLEPAAYVLPLIVTIAIAAGLVAFAIRTLPTLPSSSRRSIAWLALAAAGALGLLALYVIGYGTVGDNSAQGRYLFVGLAPMAVLAAVALADLVPAAWRPVLVGPVLVVALAFDALAIVSAVLPAYFV